jgi:hypothetical protein
MSPQDIQAALREQRFDYYHHHREPIACRVLGQKFPWTVANSS